MKLFSFLFSIFIMVGCSNDILELEDYSPFASVEDLIASRVFADNGQGVESRSCEFGFNSFAFEVYDGNPYNDSVIVFVVPNVNHSDVFLGSFTTLNILGRDNSAIASYSKSKQFAFKGDCSMGSVSAQSSVWFKVHKSHPSYLKVLTIYNASKKEWATQFFKKIII